MYDRETIEIAVRAVEDGMSRGEAAALAGCGVSSVRAWAAGATPHERLRPDEAWWCPKNRRGETVDESERTAYEAAMTENMLLRAVSGDLKEGGSPLASISNRRKCELGERLRAVTGLPLREITAFLRISKSSYEYHRARIGRDKYAALRAEVRSVFEDMGGGRGYRPVWSELRRRGRTVSEKVVRRVMREGGLTARRRRRRSWSSYAGEASIAAPNLPLRPDGTHDFSAGAPNELWVTDITEFRLPCGRKAYLSPVVDCFDGRPVSWTAGPRPSASLAETSLEIACRTLSCKEAPIVHSDRGAHYRWPGWIATCKRHGLVRSMSRKGRSADNARAEGFFGTLKSEFFYPRDWSGVALETFLAELDLWMRGFCERRASQALGWLTPDEYRRVHGYAV